jgi:hypothetical protein
MMEKDGTIVVDIKDKRRGVAPTIVSNIGLQSYLHYQNTSLLLCTQALYCLNQTVPRHKTKYYFTSSTK